MSRPRRVEVALANEQWVEPEDDRGRVHHPLGKEHPLWPAEAAERGVRHRVGTHATRMDPRRRVVVGVVGVEHGSIVHAKREIRRAAAAGAEFHVDPREHAFAVEAGAPVHAEVVALAGHRHVVVAVEANLRRAASEVRGEGGEARPLRGLRLLAPERSPHPPALAHHGCVRRAEHARDEVLHLGGMLGRGVDPHLVVLAGYRESRLPLEIEVLLPPDAHAPFETDGGGGNRGCRISTPELVGGQHLGAGGKAVVHGNPGRHRLHIDTGAPCGAPCGVAVLRDDREHHLSVKEDVAGGKDRIVFEGRAAIVYPGNVARGEHRQHPRGSTHRVEIDRPDRAARRAGAARRDVYRACRLRQVVDVGGGALHVARRAVVGEGEADARSRAEARSVRERGVGDRRVRLH